MDITIKRLRVGSDLTMRATLTDGGVRVSWQSVDNICAYMYSDAQRVMAGEAQASVDPEDPFTLVVRYTVDEPQYLGINRLVVTCSYMGQTKTYDMPVVEFVELLQEQGTSTVETVAVAVAFEVSDVTSSILDEVIAAAIAATRDAREAEADIVAAEALREAAETERQQNETERQQAEAERQEGYTEMTRKVGQMEQDVEDFGERLGDVEIVIPSAASEDNKLVDKETLDESIAFNTAHYISNNGNPFASVEELEAYPKERLTNNDYAVVVGVDEDEHTTYTYYVYNSATQSWAKEFVIDTLLTPFTDAQMAALNSGITAAILQSMQSQMEEMQRDIDGKQEQLVSGENIKTVNGQSLLGSGNIEIQGGAGDITDMNALASMVVATPTQQSFIERATPAGGIAYIPKVYGNSVVWNQLVNTTFPKTVPGNRAAINNINTAISGHTYLIGFGGAWTDSLTQYSLRLRTDNIVWRNINFDTPSVEEFHTIAVSSVSGALHVYNDCSSPLEMRFFTFTDLTEMFGAGNEPTTYEEFLQRKPKVADEYAYNEGEIINLTATGIEVTGRNLWNEQWEEGSIRIATGRDISEQDYIRIKGYLPVLPNTSYYCALLDTTAGKDGYFCYYDQNKIFITYSGNPLAYKMNKVFTTPSNCYFVRFYLNREYGATYNHDICINLSDPSFNGQYEPYKQPSVFPLNISDIVRADGTQLFPDGLLSAGSARDMVDRVNGRAEKRIGVVVFDGTENWEFVSQLYNGLSLKDIKDLKPAASIFSSGYAFGGSKVSWSNVPDKSVCSVTTEPWLWIRDTDYTSLEAWTQHLAELYAAGTPLVVLYELAETETVTFSPMKAFYKTEQGGTERLTGEDSAPIVADMGYKA